MTCPPEMVYPLSRLFLSVTYVTRGFVLPPELDTTSITAPSTNRGLPGLEEHIPAFWRSLRVNPYSKRSRKLTWERYHLSTKSGPNGQALSSAIADLESLPVDLLESIKEVGGAALAKNIDILKNDLETLKAFRPDRKSGSFRKVTAISDKEGKVRTIAILDFWSQTALRPLHDYLFKVLRRIPQDCTFNQGSFTTKLGSGKRGHYFHSFDLSNATDRFPISLIEDVLS